MDAARRLPDLESGLDPANPLHPATARPRTSPARREALLLTAILAVAFVFRAREALRTPLWFDELFTLWMARHPFAEMAVLLRGDVHPPLPTFLVWMWRVAGGEADLWLKTLPVLIGLLTVAATFGFARSLFGRHAAFLAAALLALHPVHIYFSQELRSYGLLALALLLAAWGAWRWLGSGRRRDALLWVFGASLTLHTHYLGGVVLGLLAVCVLAGLARSPRRIGGWIAIHLCIAALAAPLAWGLATQVSLAQDSWRPSPAWADLLNLGRKSTFGAYYLLPVLGGVALLPLLRSAGRRPAAFALWLAVSPVVVLFLVSRIGPHLFAERYLHFIQPFACTLFAAGVASLPWRRAAWAGTIVLLLLAGRAAVISPPLQEATTLRQAARRLAAGLASGDRVFCGDVHSLAFLDHHLPAARGVLVLGGPSLPYYQGGAMIPAERRMATDGFARVATAAGRWWGVHLREGSASTGAAFAAMDSLARGGRERFGEVTLWAGAPGMLPPSR